MKQEPNSMIEAIINFASRQDENGQPAAVMSMRYGVIQNDPHQRYSFMVQNGGDPNQLTAERGVYFLLSHNRTRLQKIGLANGKGGLRQRIRGYVKSFDPNNPGNDASPAFWYRIMTGNDLRNNRGGERIIDDSLIDVYFRSFTKKQKTDDQLTGALKIKHLNYDPHAELERILIRQVKSFRSDYRNQNPENLFPDDYPFPLLLDSVNRIPADQFAPPQ
jgi:hypothetical protein